MKNSLGASFDGGTLANVALFSFFVLACLRSTPDLMSSQPFRALLAVVSSGTKPGCDSVLPACCVCEKERTDGTVKECIP